MTEWLKVFGLGFFNDKLAAKSTKYGFAPVFLAIVLSFVFFMFGFLAADVVPFSTHYDAAGQYREFVDNAFSKSELKIEIKEGLASCDTRINTFTSDADKEKYVLNGYDLIVDTRASDTLIEFTQAAVRGDEEISYEEYSALSEKGKETYTLETRYTDTILELTNEKVEKYEGFLEEISREGTDKYNSEAAEAYKELKGKSLSQEDRNKEIYYLYVKYYYTNIQSVLMSSKAPVLCDYYYLNYILGDNDHYLYFFDDICAGSYETDGNIPSVFVGYYKDCEQGRLGGDNIDEFIKDIFYSAVGYSMSSYFTSAMQMAPAYILIPMLIGLILWAICKATKRQFGEKFTDCYKIVNSFSWLSALLTGLMTFTLGFFVFARKLYLFMPLIFAAILILRTAVFYFTASAKEQAEQTETDGEKY